MQSPRPAPVLRIPQMIENTRAKLFARQKGYTLFELIVVISLLGIVMFLSVPRFQDIFLSESADNTARWFITTIRALKEKAVLDQTDYTLHLDIDGGAFWVTSAAMTEQEIGIAMQNKNPFQGDIKIVDVEFPSAGRLAHGVIDIVFHKEGFSDKALVHMESDDDRKSILIESFLTRASVYPGFVGFEG